MQKKTIIWSPEKKCIDNVPESPYLCTAVEVRTERQDVMVLQHKDFPLTLELETKHGRKRYTLRIHFTKSGRVKSCTLT